LVGLVDGRGLAAALGAVWPAALPAALTAVAALVSRRRLGPLLTRPAQPAAVEIGHERLRRSLVLFGREYWGVLIAAAAITPWAYGVAAGAVGGRGGGMLDLVALSVVVGVLVGLPTFLFVLDRVGTRVAHLGLGPVQVGIKSKLLLLGALTPLLGYALLLHHHGRVSGTWSGGALALGGLLSVLTLTGALLSVRSMRRALRPIDELRARNGATTHRELAKLQPASADEVGLLIQALGRLFRHVVGQSSHMRAVVDNAAEGIIVTSDQGRIETFNPAAERLFGYRRSEVYGQPLSWVLPGLLGGGGAPPRLHGEQEVEGLHRDGYFMPVSVRVSEMQVSGKRMYTCLVADISGRKAAETKLRAAEARYRDLVETAHDLVWSANSEGRWTYLNRACRNIYGYDPEEMVGRALADCRAPEYARQDETAFAQLLASKELVQYETVHLDRHGN
ncbi:MAG: PAS domain S-box protein, partial [Gammaproteobacteria bacterium]|nr:PAS domain S-box protein [Gammaproteobacteria bacterium]